MNGSLPKMKYDMILDAAARELVDSSATTAKVRTRVGIGES